VRRSFRARATLAALLLAAGCGGSGRTPQSPSSVNSTTLPPPPGLLAGAVMSIVAGEDQGPVVGARVVLAGREYTSDAAGQVVLAETVVYGSLVDVVATGFLSRQTTLRAASGTRLLLWPQTTASGLDETYTAQVVYTWGSAEPPPQGSTRLQRLSEGTTQAVVVASPEILGDDQAHQAHVAAVESVNAWIGGRVRYALSSVAPGSGVVFDARVDPARASCSEVRGIFFGRYNSRGEITGGDIVYCSLDVARSGTVTHELGHSVGLQHSLVRREEVMAPFYSRARAVVFGVREGLVMNLLFERRAGNAFPDSDRSLSATASVATPGPIVCN
jgi:hypothetical protein